MNIEITKDCTRRYPDTRSEYTVDVDGRPSGWCICEYREGSMRVRSISGRYESIPIHRSFKGEEALEIAKQKIAEAENQANEHDLEAQQITV